MKLEDLERELRAERPDVDPEFARKLDEWAAAGFPRGGSLDPRTPRRRAESGFGAWFRRTRERVTADPPRRLIAPAGAAAVFAVVAGVAVSQVEFGGGDQLTHSSRPAVQDERAPAGSGGGEKPYTSRSGDDAATAADEAAVTDAGRGAQCEYCADVPEATSTAPSTVAPVPPSPDTDGDRLSRGTDDRLQDKTARLSLGADADGVQDVANDVVAVADRHDGFVLDSQVTSDQGGARASFELEIPVKELDATLTDLSELADVISRTEAAEDITAQFVRAEKERARILERIQGLRIDLIQADTREERLVLKSQIRALDAQADAYEAQANGVERRARFASVEVNVTSKGQDSADDGWSLGDAADDAGDVLRTIAGVGLISLAVLVPIALVGAVAFWLISTSLRRSRERALDV